jgi:hypothetical protein
MDKFPRTKNSVMKKIDTGSYSKMVLNNLMTTSYVTFLRVEWKSVAVCGLLIHPNRNNVAIFCGNFKDSV